MRYFLPSLFLLLGALAVQGQNQSIGFVQSEIHSIQLSSDTENSTQLLINGDPISDSFDYRVVREEGTNNVFTLELPNAIINKERFKSEYLQLQDRIVSTIESIEKINRESELYSVTFRITTRVPTAAVVSFYDDEVIKVNFISRVVPSGPVPVPEFGEYQKSDELLFNEDGTPFYPTNQFDVDKAEPAALFVSIINTGTKTKTAEELAIYLNDLMKSEINKRIGMQLNIFQVSENSAVKMKNTTLYFREKFLKPAMIIADVIPGNQRIKRMVHPEAKQGIHVEIYLGNDFN